jgi:hypothetical protein
MKVCAVARTRAGVVSFQSQIFGLRISRRRAPGSMPEYPQASSPLAFTEACTSIGFVGRFHSGRPGFVMRYRSATVADSHGLPCVSGIETKNAPI